MTDAGSRSGQAEGCDFRNPVPAFAGPTDESAFDAPIALSAGLRNRLPWRIRTKSCPFGMDRRDFRGFRIDDGFSRACGTGKGRRDPRPRGPGARAAEDSSKRTSRFRSTLTHARGSCNGESHGKPCFRRRTRMLCRCDVFRGADSRDGLEGRGFVAGGGGPVHGNGVPVPGKAGRRVEDRLPGRDRAGDDPQAVGGAGFVRSSVRDGVVSRGRARFGALFAGPGPHRVRAPSVRHPVAAE